MKYNLNVLNRRGFTLIEVLVSLAILSTALTALIISNTENIDHIGHLKNKMAAHWVGMNVIFEVRLGLIEPPIDSGEINGKSIMLNQTWHWKTRLSHTPDIDTLKINVSVSDETQGNSIVELVGFTGNKEE